MCEQHLEIYRNRSKKVIQRYRAEGKCRYCPQPRIPDFQVCETHLLLNRAKCKYRGEKLRQEIFSYYGTSCICCDESEIKFLTIDHIENNGSEHRKSEKVGSGGSFYAWLKRNNFPSGFQVLCWNCNSAKGMYGTCPHNLAVPSKDMKDKLLVIMQGHSGSGKSTLAKQIAKVIDAEIFSTDDLFVENGVYKFDASKLGLFHKKNLENCIAAMKKGVNVICDNTNTRQWEAKGYVQVAIDLGFNVKFVRAIGNFQNVHGVPNDKVDQMRNRLEELTIENVLSSKKPF
jgi:adenylate kinase family enzyme